MPNVFALSNRPGLPTFDRPEPLMAVAPDGADAPALALERLSVTRTQLVLHQGILEALDVRLTLRPPAPAAPRTLQELILKVTRCVDRLTTETGRSPAPADVARALGETEEAVVEALVAAGVGLALLPRFTTRPRDGVVLRPLRGVNARRWVVAMSRPDRAERAVVRRVVTAFEEVGRPVVSPPKAVT